MWNYARVGACRSTDDRWSGESDVFESLEATRARLPIDPKRIVLRGFSMGGAGAWHIGIHYPDRWAAVEAGAGFTETVRYARLSDLPEHQRRALRVYDAVDCARNVLEVPFVGYGGEKDAQLQAATNIHDALIGDGHRFERSGLDRRGPFLFLVGPGAGHTFLSQSRRISEAFIELELAFADRDRDRVRFVTPTLRYDRGTNALLFPRLGDWALLRVAGLRPGFAEEAVVASGFFDEEWGWGP